MPQAPCLRMEDNVWCRRRPRHRLTLMALAVQEHLILVTELLRANLFEFQRFTQASGETPYFTPARVRLVARQVPPPPPPRAPASTLLLPRLRVRPCPSPQPLVQGVPCVCCGEA